MAALARKAERGIDEAKLGDEQEDDEDGAAVGFFRDASFASVADFAEGINQRKVEVINNRGWAVLTRLSLSSERTGTLLQQAVQL